MTQFVRTNSDYLNLGEVRSFDENADKKTRLRTRDGERSETYENLSERVIQLVPVTRAMDVLIPFIEEDGSTTILVDPLLAMGLTATGEVVLITARDRQGVPGGGALREPGQDMVTVRDGSYPTVEAWLKEQSF